MGIYEVMEVSPEIRRLLHRSAATHELRAQLEICGCSTLRDEGVALATAGKTSLEEVLRVTHSDDVETSQTELPAPTPSPRRRRKAAGASDDAKSDKEV